MRTAFTTAPFVAAVVAIVLATSGCAATPEAAPEATPTSVPSATPEPSPTPTEQPTTATVSIGGDGIAVLDAQGAETFTFGWKDEPDALIASLESAFGFAPTVEVNESDSFHSPDYTEYHWEAFTLSIAIVDRVAKPDYYLLDLARVHSTTATVGTVAITADSGAQVGQTVDELAAFTPIEHEVLEGARQLLVDPEFPEQTDPTKPENTNMVALFVAPGEEVATEIFAPVLSHGGL